jgi:lysyl-tRNA synthetase class 2
MQSKLWARFRDRLCSAKFRRQHAIGPFIAGFCCVERGLVVELDGGQHLKQAKKDQRRTALIERRGYRVLRVWDNEVLKNMAAVLEQIATALNDPHPYPHPRRARVKNRVKAQ